MHHLLSESRRTMQDGSKEQRGIPCEQPAGTKRIPLSVVLAVQPTLQGGVSASRTDALYVLKAAVSSTATEVVPRRIPKALCRFLGCLRLRWTERSAHRKTNFVKLAEGFGLKGYRCHDLPEFQAAFADALKQKGPTWIECIIDKDEKVLPMIPGGGDINDIIME